MAYKGAIINLINKMLTGNEFFDIVKNQFFANVWTMAFGVIGVVIAFFWKKIINWYKLLRMVISPLFWSQDTCLQFMAGEKIGKKFDRQLQAYKFFHPRKYKQAMAMQNPYKNREYEFTDTVTRFVREWRDNPPPQII